MLSALSLALPSTVNAQRVRHSLSTCNRTYCDATSPSFYAIL